MANGKERLRELHELYSKAKTKEETEKVIALQHKMQDAMTPEELEDFNNAIIDDAHESIAELDRMIAVMQRKPVSARRQ